MSMEVVNSVGRRKAAVARVYVKPGKGNITINQKPLDTYFPLEIFQYVVKQPLLVTSTTENFDITITLDGGGIKGQAEAARLGIARALCALFQNGRDGVGYQQNGDHCAQKAQLAADCTAPCPARRRMILV